MAERSGGGGFGWFIIGVAVGAAGIYFGPGAYQQYAKRIPSGHVRVDVDSNYVPGQWHRRARLDIEFSRLNAQGRNWDWPFTDPELQVCIREGDEIRRCLGPKDPALASCQGKFRCTTAVIAVPDVPFTVELNEWDDFNPSDPIGAVTCDIGQTCKFDLGVVTVRAA